MRKIYYNFRKIIFTWLGKLFSLKEEISFPENPKNILIGRSDRLGDLVLSVPAISAIREKYPEAKITLLQSKSTAGLKISGVDSYLTAKLGRVLLLYILRKLPQFDLTINLSSSNNLKSSIMCFLYGKNSYRIGFASSGQEVFYHRWISPNYNIHLTSEMANLLSTIDIKELKNFSNIVVDSSELEVARSILSEKLENCQKFIFIHSGARYPTQRWGDKNYFSLAKEIVRRFPEYGIIFYPHNKKFRSEGNIFVLPEISLARLVAFLSLSVLFVGNNSGPLHLAAALGVPTISLAGPTNLKRFSPVGKNNIIISRNLPCQPCFKGYCFGHKCLRSIGVSDVLKIVLDFLKK